MVYVINLKGIIADRRHMLAVLVAAWDKYQDPHSISNQNVIN